MAQREIRGRQTGPGFLRSGESGYGGARAWGRGFDVDGVCSNWGWDFNVRRGLDAEAARKEAAVKRPARKSLISASPNSIFHSCPNRTNVPWGAVHCGR